MREVSEREKKDKKFSMIMSGIVHGTLLLIFLLLVAWSPPDPPIPEYGMELNLGFEDEGSGDVESEISSTEETDNTTPPESDIESEETQEEVQEEIVDPQPEETQDPVEPVEEVIEETTDPVEEVADPVEATEEVVTAEETQETESDVKVEEKKEEEPEKEKEEEAKPPVTEEKKEEEKPVEEKKEEPKKEEPKPDPVVNNRALLGSKKSDTNSKEAASGSQGNKTDERGNMGKPTGSKDSNGLAENAGNLGVSLSLDGWAWDRAPSGKDDSEIDGVILFQIKVDDRGVVKEVTKMPGTTISDNTVVDFYKKEVQKLSFKRTLSAQAAPISVGEIKFIIKTK